MVSSQVLDRCFVRFALLVAFSLTTLPLTSTAQILPGGSGGTIFTPPQNLSNDPGNSWAHQMVVDHQGNLDLTWWDDSPGYGAFFFKRSIDGGLTFSSPQSLSNDPGGTGPANMAVDSAGTIYLAWGTGTGAFFSRSSDGSNFSAPVQIINYAAAPSIALGPNGNIYVGWVDETLYHNVFFSRSEDGGGSFSSPILLSATLPFDYHPLIAADYSGNINVVWQSTLGGDTHIAFTRSSDGGNSFTAPVVLLGGDSRSLGIALDSSGNIDVVFSTVPFGNVFLDRSTDGGVSFALTNVSNNNNIPHYITPGNARMVLDCNDNIDVVWDDSIGNIFFTRSTDQGTTFTSKAIANGTVHNFAPRIALDSSGNINLVWIGLTSSYDIFFSRSTDNGTTFSPAQKLSNNTGNSSPDPQIVLDSLGNAYITWIDYSSGNADVFFTRDLVQVPPALPSLPSLP